MIDMTRKEFLKKFSNMSHKERCEVALNLFYTRIDQPLSWYVCWLEINQRTKLSKEILDKLTYDKLL